MLAKSKDARAADEQANRQMQEEMDRLPDGSVEEGRPPGTAAGSACGRDRLRQSGGEG